MHSAAARQPNQVQLNRASDQLLLRDWDESPSAAHIELSLIAQRLGAISASVGGSPIEPLDADLAMLARALWRMRCQRSTIFDSGLFGEPAWDMLLDLFYQQVSKRKIYVKSVCIGANVPTSTGLRWIESLRERGLVEREADTKDRRRQSIELSSEGMAKMRLCLKQMWDQLSLPQLKF